MQRHLHRDTFILEKVYMFIKYTVSSVNEPVHEFSDKKKNNKVQGPNMALSYLLYVICVISLQYITD